MVSKDKKKPVQVQEDHDECDDSDCDQDHDDDVDIEEQVINKIKTLPTLQEKVQAIALNGLLIQKRELDKQLQNEQQAEELKFRSLYKPFVDQINAIINGTHTFSDADFQQIGQLLTAQQNQTKHNYYTQQAIPQYWLKVFMNSDVIGQTVEQRDQNLLKHLTKVQAGKSEDLKKLWVDFYFSQNEWFSNVKLHKQFELENEVIKKSFGDKIQWKEGKNITIKIVKKKKKKGGQKKTVEQKQKSFFNFFKDIEIESDDQEEAEDQQDNEVEELEQQYQIANSLYEDIVPKSLQYYLGLVESFGDLQDGEFDDEGDN